MLPGRQYTWPAVAAIAWRHRWVIFIPMIVGAYGGLIISSRLPDLYQSEMLIQVVPQRVPDKYVQSTVTMRTEERLSALSEQITSRTELERLIQQMNLYAEERGKMPMQDVVEHMRSHIRVEPVRAVRPNQDPDSFYVRFSYTEPELAARVTERLGALFIEVNARDRGDLAAATSNFLQTQLTEARQRLEQQEAKVKQFREQHAGRLPSQLPFNMQVIQSTQMEVQALVESIARDRDRKLLLERLDVEAQLELPGMAQNVPPAVAMPGSQVTDLGPAAGATTTQQLATARDVLSRLLVRLTPEHPDVVRTKRTIARLEARLSEESKVAEHPAVPQIPVVVTPEQAARRERQAQRRAEIESLTRQITAKEAKEQQLRADLQDYQRRIEQVPGLESEWAALTRDYDTQQAAYKALLANDQQARVATDLERRQIGEQFRILDPARTPVRPTGVNRLLLNTIATAGGLAFGLLVVGLMEVRDRTFRSGSDVIEACKLPVLVLLPLIMTEDQHRAEVRRRRLLSCAALVLAGVATYGFWALKLWKHIA